MVVADTSAAPAASAAGPLRRSARTWAPTLAYLLGAAALVVVYYTVPARHLLVWLPFGLVAVVSTVVGVRRHRPADVVAWYLFAVALALFAAGDATYDVLTVTFGQENPFPSLADVLYLTMYPVAAAGLLRLIRRRSVNRDTGSLIDAMIVTVGLGLLSWVYLILPYVEADDLTIVERAVAIAYPLGDVLMLALLARLVAGGLRLRSLQTLALGTAGLLIADVLYGTIQLTGEWRVGGPVDLGWIVCYLAWGGAALHPSMRRVTDPVPTTAGSVRGRRLVMLALVSLIAPGVMLAQPQEGAAATRSATIAVFSAVLYLLVVIRLAAIVRTHQASVQRERALRSAGEGLVAARTATDVYQVTLLAAARLVGAGGVEASAIYVRQGTDEDGDGNGDGRGSGSGGGQRVAGDTDPADPQECWRLAGADARTADGEHLSISVLSPNAATTAMLVVRTPEPMRAEVRDALGTLASQVALALERVALADEVRRQQNDAHFKGMIQNASDVILVLSRDGVVDYGTPSLERTLGRTPEEIVGRQIETLLDPDTAHEALRQLADVVEAGRRPQAIAEWWLRGTDGDSRPFEVAISNLLSDANVGGVVLTMRDVSERRRLEEQLRHQAFHDGLTGLANRVLLHDHVDQALARMRRHGGTLALVMLDLDDFKLVNDRLGHAAGDELLTTTARRLTGCVRTSDTVARLGGDEFAVLMEEVPDAGVARDLALRMVGALGDPVVISGEEIFARASAGLVVHSTTDPSVSSIDIMRQADLALYAAKDQGKGQVVTFVDELHARMLEREERKRELRRAIDEEQFQLYYQPIVELATGDIVGAEALVRWNHPERGLIGPGHFIGIAEESGLIVELGRWVLAQAVREASAWGEIGGRRTRISVNVSARQLQEPDFAAEVTRLVAERGVRPTDLVLEITESVLVSKGPATLEVLESLRRIGVRIAVDDFGIGYSSLAYLQDLPIDILKIDKSFVDRLGSQGRRGGALVNAIITLAESLELDLVAEGIERIEQRDELWTMGCALGQGYLLAEPMNRCDFVDALLLGRLGPDGPRAGLGNDRRRPRPMVPAPVRPPIE